VGRGQGVEAVDDDVILQRDARIAGLRPVRA
jgi:hypothetical protein